MSALQRQLNRLPKVKVPFLPAISTNPKNNPSKSGNAAAHVRSPSGDGRFGSERKYTLVLDLDETLIHYVDKGDAEGESYFLIRPFCDQFLREMAQYYEVVIFTAAVQEYADWVID